MEAWFSCVLLSVVLAGIPSFILKIGTERRYNSGVFVFYGAIASVFVLLPCALFLSGVAHVNVGAMFIAFGMGLLVSLGSIFRMYALSCIDTVIYYPLVRLLSPALVVVIGIMFFGEHLTKAEWLGLVLCACVPLLCITRSENGRQRDLVRGVVLVVVTGVISALVSTLGKYISNVYTDVLWIVTAISFGVSVGSLGFIFFQSGCSHVFGCLRTDSSLQLVLLASFRGVTLVLSYVCFMYAFVCGGPLAIVHTIQSLYILVPIVLSVIFYNEHWDARKVGAIALSLAVLGLLK